VRILFDQNLPHKLRTSLLDRSSHEISTAAYKGWSALKNGDLLRAAERDGFDVFVTGDTTLVLEQKPDQPEAGDRNPIDQQLAHHKGQSSRNPRRDQSSHSRVVRDCRVRPVQPEG
jgi:hypothetical protein